MWKTIQLYTDTFNYTPTHSTIYRHIQLYTDTFNYTPTHSTIHRHIQLYTDTFTALRKVPYESILL